MKFPVRKRVCIVADGPSAELLRMKQLPQTLYVIGVNNASVWLPRCNAYITANPDNRQRHILNNHRTGVRYFASVPAGYGSALTRGHQRGPREPNVSFLTQSDTFTEDPKKCAGGDSTFAALNLACHMRAEKIAIIGLDGDDRPRVSGGRPYIACDPELFAEYTGNAEVVNGSLSSTIDAFPKMGAAQAIDWLL